MQVTLPSVILKQNNPKYVTICTTPGDYTGCDIYFKQLVRYPDNGLYACTSNQKKNKSDVSFPSFQLPTITNPFPDTGGRINLIEPNPSTVISDFLSWGNYPIGNNVAVEPSDSTTTTQRCGGNLSFISTQ